MLNRELQRSILVELAQAYPEGLYDLPAAKCPGCSDRDLLVNVQYLAEHGLVNSGYVRRGTIGSNEFIPSGEHTITARGLDFLADDGGLTAVLGTVTVRLAADTLQALVEARLQASNLPPEEKTRISSLLRSLGTEALTEATKRMVNEGLDRWPQALEWLGTLRG